MILYLAAETSIPDVVVDFIEVQLKNGEQVSLNWDESSIARSENGFEAKYKGVYFGEEYANGRIDDLKDLQITDIGLYFESSESPVFAIKEMLFEDDDRSLTIKDPVIPHDCSGMEGFLSNDKALQPATPLNKGDDLTEEMDSGKGLDPAGQDRNFLLKLALESYEYVADVCVGDAFFQRHADAFIYGYQNNVSDIDMDFWVQYEDLLGEKMSYDEYVFVDKLYDGDPLELIDVELTEEEKAEFADLKAALGHYRDGLVNAGGLVRTLVDQYLERWNPDTTDTIFEEIREVHGAAVASAAVKILEDEYKSWFDIADPVEGLVDGEVQAAGTDMGETAAKVFMVSMTKSELDMVKSALDVMGDRMADREGYSSGEAYWDLKEKLSAVESISKERRSLDRIISEAGSKAGTGSHCTGIEQNKDTQR